MTDFNWQTDDDGGWDDDVVRPNPPSSRRNFKLWFIPLMLLALIGMAGWLLYSRVSEQVVVATDMTESNVTNTFEQLHQISAEGDLEIFMSLMSGRDPDWVSVQQLLVANNGLLNRDGFGFTLVDEVPTITQVTLSPDLTAAEIAATTRYDVRIGAGVTQTVALSHPTIFRQGRSGWLYAPPLDEFWGDIVTTTHPLDPSIQVTVPSRDLELSQQILRDIWSQYEIFCADQRLPDCSIAVDSITFSTILGAEMLSENQFVDHNGTLVLPTPTIVGLPSDRAGYFQLRAGYADKILRSVSAEKLGHNCCGTNVNYAYFDALFDWQLAEMNLRVWPLEPNQYVEILDNSVRKSNNDPLLWYGFVEFIITLYDTPEMLALEGTLGSNMSEQAWILALFNADFAQTGFNSTEFIETALDALFSAENS